MTSLFLEQLYKAKKNICKFCKKTIFDPLRVTKLITSLLVTNESVLYRTHIIGSV